jgi:hypothetical protein
MNFRKTMKDKHTHATRVEHLMRTIEHCISVIAICRAGGQENACASYEARLTQLNEELAELLKENGKEHEAAS